MIKNHPEYKWEFGRESHYFLLALQEFKSMLEKNEITWLFHDQCNVLRRPNGTGYLIAKSNK